MADAVGCRFCGSPLEHLVVDLGMSPLCERYLTADQLDQMEPFYPLRVQLCDQCMLVQLQQYVSPAEIFGEYAYFSSFSTSWVEHARRFCHQAAGRFDLDGGSLVVEVASNDGYLLRHLVAMGIPVLGIEPAGNVAAAAVEAGVPSITEFFGAELGQQLRAEGRAADLLVANNVLAQVPDLNDFVAGMRVLLAPGGVASVEFPHLPRLFAGNQFDTIYHEHFSYFTLLAARRIFAHHGLVEDSPGREQREVREMLVVDGVELVAGEQARQVRELDAGHPAGGQQHPHPRHEVVEIGHLGEDVVGDQQVRRPSLRPELLSQLGTEELRDGGHARLDRCGGDVARRLDPQHRYAHRDQVAQQVAVVAGDLDHQAAAVEVEPPGGLVAETAGVLHPGGREGGEVGILAEDLGGTHVLLQLHQHALVAELHPQRVERLHLVELVSGQVALAQRRHAEIDDQVLQRRAAEPAPDSVRHPPPQVARITPIQDMRKAGQSLQLRRGAIATTISVIMLSRLPVHYRAEPGRVHGGVRREGRAVLRRPAFPQNSTTFTPYPPVNSARFSPVVYWKPRQHNYADCRSYSSSSQL